jgi:hypothetical protein
MHRSPLRVAVIIDDPAVPRWVAHVLETVDASSVAAVVGFVLTAEPRPRRGLLARVWAGRSHLLFRLYSWIDARRFGEGTSPLDEVDMSRRLETAAVATATRLASKHDAERFDDDTLAQIRRWDLDVLLKLDSNADRGAVLNAARHGVWAYLYGTLDSDRGDPPLFWEIHDGVAVSESSLLRLTGRPEADEVLYRSTSATDRISLHRSRARIYRKSAEFVVRKLRDLHRDGEIRGLDGGHGPGRKAPARHTPTNLQMLRFGWRVMIRLVRQKAGEAVAREQWFVAYRRRGAELPTTEAFRGATILIPPRDRLFADPCLVDRGSSSYLFFEELSFAQNKGLISCCELMPDGRTTPPEIVLERSYHLSYPFVFLVGDDAYMLPETAANHTVELYKAEAFPNDWRLDATLLDGVRAVDPTLIERDGRYWLFANIAVEEGPRDDELFLFSAESPRGPWVPHPRNPVVSDARCARPAGRPFIDQSGALIRPSQDCSDSYGRAIVFNRVEVLSDTDYRETTIGRLEPGWRRANRGTHTYSRSEGWEAVDGRALVSKLGGYLDARRPAGGGAGRGPARFDG